jgi:hypothetical protein
MGIEHAIARPPRCTIVNVATAEAMECLFNPTQLTEKLQVAWNRLVVPGLSHQVLQYQSTGNRQLAGVEFYLDRRFAAAQPGHPDVREFRNFLRALTVPPAALGPAAAAPPRVLVVWPGLLTMESIVTDVEFQFRQFAADGSALVFAATCTFEEILDARVTSEALRRGAS